MAHFYLDEALESAEIGGIVAIAGTEARHAVTVSRLEVGERVAIGNGRGLVVSGSIVSAAASELAITVESVERRPREAPAIVLAQALAKGDRDELAIQAATELGVDAVLPWGASRSISKWDGAKIAKGHDRWSAIVREASKQSLRAWVPDVLDLATTKQLARLAEATRMLVLEPASDAPLSAIELDDRDVTLVVGPEGGVAPAELELLAAAGAELVSLGRNVLRTSTAGPAGVAALSLRLGRW